MDAIAYSATYQMTYLFLETVEGGLSNHKLNDSFQPFLTDLEEAIKNDQKESLEAVENSVVDYYEPLLDSEEGTKRHVNAIIGTLQSLVLSSELKEQFFKKTLENLWEEKKEDIA